MPNKYEFTPKMREISGFGGGYEATCRKMLQNGLNWFDKHPSARVEYGTYKGVYGICLANNKDAKSLDKAILKGIFDSTGAMHHAVVSHLLFIKNNGWNNYVKEMSKIDK